MFRGIKKDRAINCVSYRKREPGARNWRDNSSQNRHAGKSLRVGRANRREPMRRDAMRRNATQRNATQRNAHAGHRTRFSSEVWFSRRIRVHHNNSPVIFIWSRFIARDGLWAAGTVCY